MRTGDAMIGRVRGEQGVSAVIVVVSLTALFGASMLSVDAGNVWTTRRALIGHVDAAALAAARHIDAGGAAACSDARGGGLSSGAATQARSLITADDGHGVLEALIASPHEGNCSHGAGRVRVEASDSTTLAFAGMFGLGQVRPFAAATAQYGPLISASGLRPFSICDKSPHFVEWAAHLNGNDGTWGTGSGHRVSGGAIVHRIYFQRGSSGCGSASGNWDWLDFNDSLSPNGATMLAQWLESGYPGRVSLGDASQGIPADCNPEQSGSQAGCSPKTGATGGATEDALTFLRDSRTVFPIVVHDRVVDERDAQECNTPPPWDGSGTNGRYCPVAFLLVRVHGWDKITGQLSDNSYFDLEFIDDWWLGQVGRDPSGGRPTIHGAQLCGTEYGGKSDDHCDV